MKKIIIVLGPPGSGKGTQAKKIAEKYDLFYFGIGDLLREEAKQNTEYGKIFKRYLIGGTGQLINDELVIEYVHKKINEISLDNGIVFDGYPRTLVQIEDLENILAGREKLIIDIEVDENLLLERISTRRICGKCEKVFKNPEGIKNCDDCGGELIMRTDDTTEEAKKRINVYKQRTIPVIDYYQKKGIMVSVNGNPPIDEVWKNIQKIIDDD